MSPKWVTVSKEEIQVKGKLRRMADEPVVVKNLSERRRDLGYKSRG